LRIRRAPGLLHGVIGGRRYVHNPRVPGALAILGVPAAAMLDAADGRDSEVIAQALCDGVSSRRDALLGAVLLLLRNGFVRAPGVAPRRRAARERVFNLWVHVTNACNLRCPYCYIHKSADHLAPEAARRLLATIEATAASGRVARIHARYAGGEPMLRFDAMRAFHERATARCEPHGVRFSAAVLTNGTALPPGAIRWLKDRRIGLSVSIDGVGDVQDRMRPTVHGHGSAALLEATLDRYLEAGIRPFVLITVGADNLDGLPELTARLLQRKLAFRYSLSRDIGAAESALMRRGSPGGLGADGILTGAPLRRLQDIFGRCYDLIEADVRARAPDDPAPAFRNTHVFCDLSPWRPIGKACGAGESFLAVGHDGAFTPCQAALGSADGELDPGATLIDNAARHRPFGAFARGAVNAACARCRHAPSCAGGCPLLLHRRDGHVDGRSPFCEVFKFVIPRIVRIAALELIAEGDRRRAERSAA